MGRDTNKQVVAEFFATVLTITTWNALPHMVRSCARANLIDCMTSHTPRRLAISKGCLSIMPFQTLRAGIVARIARPKHFARRPSSQPRRRIDRLSN